MILHQQLLNFVVKTYLMQLNMFLACHLSKEFFQKIWSPIFKKDEKFFFTNYRLIPVLPRFSKLLEKIMYNRLYRYLSENNYMKSTLVSKLHILQNTLWFRLLMKTSTQLEFLLTYGIWHCRSSFTLTKIRIVRYQK